jgi:hypothetical protein
MRFSRRYLSEQPRKVLKAAGFSDYGIYKVLRSSRRLSPYMKQKAVQSYALCKMKDSGINLKEGKMILARSRGKEEYIDKARNKMVKYARELMKLNKSVEKSPNILPRKALKAIIETLSNMDWTVQDIEEYMKVRRSAGYADWKYYKGIQKTYGQHVQFHEAMQVRALKALHAPPENFPFWYTRKQND